MPITTLSGSTAGTSVSPYKNTQSTPGNTPQNPTTPERITKKESSFSVEISQEALELQKQEKTVQTETEQRIQNDREIREETDQMLQEQRAEAKEYAKQQSIDITV